jgi:hypothetical protein
MTKLVRAAVTEVLTAPEAVTTALTVAVVVLSRQPEEEPWLGLGFFGRRLT